MIVPVYISESCPPAIRGRLIGIFEICLQFAQIFGFWVNYGVNKHVSKASDSQWHIPFALQLVPGSLLVICMFFQPESPRWLLNANRVQEARKVLQRLRGLPEGHEYLDWEINTVLAQIEEESLQGAKKGLVAKLQEIALPQNRGRLLLGISLMFIQNMSGINALNYFSPSIFAAIGFTGTSIGLLATGIFGIVKASATAIFMIWGVDKLGRRRALLIGSVGAAIALFYIGGYTQISGSFEGVKTGSGKTAGGYAAIAMIYIFAVFYAMSWNGIPWIFWYVSLVFEMINTDNAKCRSVPHGYQIRVSCVHHLRSVAGAIHHCLLDTIHDDKHQIWDFLPVWFLCRFRLSLLMAICPGDEGIFAGRNGHFVHSQRSRVYMAKTSGGKHATKPSQRRSKSDVGHGQEGRNSSRAGAVMKG
jgi:hypothetical protein